MKKRFLIGFASITAAILIAAGILWHIFTPANHAVVVYRKDGQSTAEIQNAEAAALKPVLSDAMLASRISEPGLDTNVRLCDLAVYGRITDISFCTIDAVTGKASYDKYLEQSSATPAIPYTKYTIAVSDVLMGDLGASKTVEYFEMGRFDAAVTKPKEKGEVVLFLNKRSFGYISVDSEHSIFTVKDNQVYSYSNHADLYRFDGKNLSTLLLATHDAAKNRPAEKSKCNIVVK